MDSCYLTPSKDHQNINKITKNHTQSRQGDWICFNCNNLNFSFRKKCNRCKTQTRKQNQDFQNVYSYYYYNQNAHEQYFYPMEGQNNTYLEQVYVSQDQVKIKQNQIINNSHQLSQIFDIQKIQLLQNQSPLKEIQKNYNVVEKTNYKKLRTPSSKKKSNIFNNDLPSVSPLLKKLLEKQNTTYSKKDKLNVSLFYDEVWNTNKQNLSVLKINFQQNSDKKTSKDMKDLNCMSISGKKPLENSSIHKTNDSFSMDCDGFPFFNSPDKEDNQIIQIDQGDEQLAQIIRRIII